MAAARAQRDEPELRVAAAGGPAITVLTLDETTRCDFVFALNASPRLLVARVLRNTKTDRGCGFEGRFEYLVLRPGERAMHLLASPDGCPPGSVDADVIVQLAEGLRPGAVGARSATSTGRRCRQATSRGTLTSLAARAGRCAPTRFLRAKGASTWRLTLGRRLPKGRYVVYARAVDLLGRVSRLTAKDAKVIRAR